jgi:hypothetical protein
LASQACFTFAYVISSFVVSSNSYAGFNAVLLGIIYIGMTGLVYLKMKNNTDRLTYGVILGIGVMLIFISLESAIFWGQYSRCSTTIPQWDDDYMSHYPTSLPSLAPDSRRRLTLIETVFSEYFGWDLRDGFTMTNAYGQQQHRQLSIGLQCNNRGAMRAVCTFSIFLFLSYLFLVALFIRFKEEILKNASSSRSGYSAVSNNLDGSKAGPIPAVSSKIPSSYATRSTRYD